MLSSKWRKRSSLLKSIDDELTDLMLNYDAKHGMPLHQG